MNGLRTSAYIDIHRAILVKVGHEKGACKRFQASQEESNVDQVCNIDDAVSVDVTQGERGNRRKWRAWRGRRGRRWREEHATLPQYTHTELVNTHFFY